jgi:hypothetical protein
MIFIIQKLAAWNWLTKCGYLVWKIEKIYPDYYFGHLLTVPGFFIL